MFAPLSLAAKEHVASHLVPVAVAAGELVIRAGDVGDRFYIVADGELDIDVDGRHVDRGPRRTTSARSRCFATCRARRASPAIVDSQLYALQREDFLAAVTGHSAAHAAGEAVVDERLGGVGYQSG